MTAVAVPPASGIVTVVSLAALSAGIAAVVSFVHRLYSREASPVALNVLAGLGGVAFALNTAGALASYTQEGAALVSGEAVVVNLASLAAGAATAVYAGTLGDRAGVELTTLPDYEGDVGRLVRSAGRHVTVRVPDADAIRDTEGYDPVADETKEAVAGKEYVFPRGVTVEELRSRLVERLKQEGDIGYVDVEIDDSGDVDFLALGRSISGVGPTLPPGNCAVVVRADPAYGSSAGDTVRLFKKDETGEVERVADAELRGAVDDTVTVAVDNSDVRRIDPDANYRMVTLPSEKLPEREFAAMLRSSDETVAVVEVDEGNALVGERLDSLGVSVVAVKSDGDVSAVPDKTRTIGPGDVLYAVGSPADLRRLG